MRINKRFLNLAGIFSSTILFAACATSGVQRGVVAMKISETDAHVGIGKNEVHEGDHVELFRNICTGGGGKEEKAPRTCKKELLGHGVVSKVLNDDYSEVQFPAGTKFSEGDTIEKHQH